MKKWMILHNQQSEDIIKILLKNRGLTGEKEIEEFLHPSLDQLTIEKIGINKHELKKAADRIKKAIVAKESIIVYTDYDADGICAGAIIWETLFELGAQVMPYVPHRMKEGYGLSKKGIDFLRKEYNTALIITVDHGVTASKKIDYAKKLKIDTIVLDHHILPKKPPKAVALIHTTKLCAGGIAWIFSSYLLGEVEPRKRFNLYRVRNLDLAALATIADLVPLLGTNRVIVKFGLEELNRTKRIGLKAIIEEAGLKQGEINTYEVGHVIAPRINAMGRLASALDSLRLICTKDSNRALALARELGTINRERQILTEKMTSYAMLKIKTNKNLEKIIIVGHESFQEGIIGLIAGKIVERYSRPAIVVSVGKEYSKASARSIDGFNIVETIRKVSHLLEDVGGHPMAAGFTVSTKNLKQLKEKLITIAEKELDEEKLVKVIKIDLKINFSQITKELYHKLLNLAPFGLGNPQPVFASDGVEIMHLSLVGKEKQHLKLTLRQGNSGIFQAIGFGMGEYSRKLFSGAKIGIAYTIEENNWNNHCCLQLKLKDVKITA